MSAPQPPIWTPRAGIGWARTHFTWGFASGCLFTEAVFALLMLGDLMIPAFLFALSLFTFRCAKRAKRPLFVADRHVKDYQ